MFLKAPSYCMDEAKVQNRLIGARWWGGGAGQHCFRMMKDAPAEQLAILDLHQYTLLEDLSKSSSASSLKPAHVKIKQNGWPRAIGALSRVSGDAHRCRDAFISKERRTREAPPKTFHNPCRGPREPRVRPSV